MIEDAHFREQRQGQLPDCGHKVHVDTFQRVDTELSVTPTALDRKLVRASFPAGRAADVQDNQPRQMLLQIERYDGMMGPYTDFQQVVNKTF